MTENIRLTSGLLIMSGFIFVGIGVYYFDEGVSIGLWGGTLLLGLSATALGFWSIYSPLIPSFIAVIFFPLLFLFLSKTAPDFTLSRWALFYWGLLFSSVLGSAVDAYRQYKGLPNSPSLEQSEITAFEMIARPNVPNWVRRSKYLRFVYQRLSAIDGSVIQLIILRLLAIPIILFAALLILGGLVGLLIEVLNH